MRKSAFRDGEVVSGGLLAALGLYILLEARNWTYSGPEGPGPGFFPIWYGVLMIGLSLLLIIGKLMKEEPGENGVTDWRGLGRALSTWLAFVAAIALLRPLGFLISFGLLTLFLVFVVFGRSFFVAVITALALALGFQLTFPLALGVPLPTGLLGI